MKKFVTTKGVWRWNGYMYVLVEREGYDYDGPWSLAMGTDFSSWDMNHWKWYNDDAAAFGSITSAASEDTAITPSMATNYHLRIQFTNTGAALGDLQARLQYELNNSTTWVTVTSSSAAVIESAAGNAGFETTETDINSSTAVAGEALTTVGSSGYDDRGRYIETGTGAEERSLGADKDTNWMWCIQFVESGLGDGDTVKFRVVNAAFSDDVPDNINYPGPMANISLGGGGAAPPFLPLLGVG